MTLVALSILVALLGFLYVYALWGQPYVLTFSGIAVAALLAVFRDLSINDATVDTVDLICSSFVMGMIAAGAIGGVAHTMRRRDIELF